MHTELMCLNRTKMIRNISHVQVVLYCIVLYFFLLVLDEVLVTPDYNILFMEEQVEAELHSFYKMASLWSYYKGSIFFFFFLTMASMLLIPLLHRRHTLPKLQHHFVLILILLGSFCYYSGIVMYVVDKMPWTATISQPFSSFFNPTLKDALLVIHPPIIFCSYSIIISVLFLYLHSSFSRSLTKYGIRRIYMIAYSVLTFALVLGSMWAYWKLGWGGWWFWDPVENISLIPWILLYVFFHSSSFYQKNVSYTRYDSLIIFLSGWAVICSFFLSKLRVVDSVHSFSISSDFFFFFLSILFTWVFVSLAHTATVHSHLHALNPASARQLVKKEHLIYVYAILIVLLYGSLGLYKYFIQAIFSLEDVLINTYFYTETIIPLFIIASLLISSLFSRKVPYYICICLIFCLFLPFPYKVKSLVVVFFLLYGLTNVLYERFFIIKMQAAFKKVHNIHMYVFLCIILGTIASIFVQKSNICGDIGDYIFIEDLSLAIANYDIKKALGLFEYRIHFNVIFVDDISLVGDIQIYKKMYYMSNGTMPEVLQSFPTILISFYKDIYFTWFFLDTVSNICIELTHEYFQTLLWIVSCFFCLKIGTQKEYELSYF